MSAAMCEHIRVYTNRDTHTYSKGLVASLISNCLVVREARRMTYRSPEEIQIVVYLFCLRDFPWTRRETCARSSFPSEIRRSGSRIQKTRDERENREKEKKGKKKIKTWNTERRGGWIRVDSRYKIRLWNTHGYFAAYTLKIRSYRVANVATVIAG